MTFGSGHCVNTPVRVSLMTTIAVQNLKTHQIYTALQAGASMGMQTMDQHMSELVKSGRVSYENALEMCHSVEEFKRLCGRAAG